MTPENESHERGIADMGESLKTLEPLADINWSAGCEARYRTLKDRHARILGSRGLECDGGWLELISRLCDALQHCTDHHGGPQVEVHQVKEKFGALRFYVGQANDYQRGLIDAACKASTQICETCGRQGTLWVSGGYFHTACERHKRPESITVDGYLAARTAKVAAAEAKNATRGVQSLVQE